LTLLDDTLEVKTDVGDDSRAFWCIYQVKSQDEGVIELECSIRRTITTNRKSPTVTNGRSDGGYAANLSATNCRVRQTAGSETQVAGGRRAVNTYEFIVNASKDIIGTDQIVYSDPDSVTHKLDVTAVINAAETDELKVITATETKEVV
jgi:hypothetical protein